MTYVSESISLIFIHYLFINVLILIRVFWPENTEDGSWHKGERAATEAVGRLYMGRYEVDERDGGGGPGQEQLEKEDPYWRPHLEWE